MNGEVSVDVALQGPLMIHCRPSLGVGSNETGHTSNEEKMGRREPNFVLVDLSPVSYKECVTFD